MSFIYFLTPTTYSQQTSKQNMRPIILFLSIICQITLAAQEFTLPLWETAIPNYQATDEQEQVFTDRGIQWVTQVQQPSMDIYLPTPNNATGQAVIICPGGGYHGLAYDWEGTDIARWLNSKGIAGIVLKYRLPLAKSNIERHKSPLLDAQRAMRLVRSKAKEWHIYPDQIGIMGFSAGGHLASTLGTHFDYGIRGGDAIEAHSCRPDFMILMYPVISTTADFIHAGSKEALLGEHPTEELVQYFSNELQVSATTPPTFLLHSGDDDAVPVENSLVFYQALIDKKVPAELHVYPMGGHGFSLAIGQSYLQTWTDRLGDWLKALKTTDPQKEDWQPLFNEKDLTGWDIHIAGRPMNENYKNTFLVEEDLLRINYSEYEQFDEKYGHLYYHQPFSYYKLQFDYRFVGEQTKGGAVWNVRNSGIMLHSQSAESVGDDQHFPVSIEIQLLGGLGKGPRTTANICTPGTLFQMDGKDISDHCYNSSSKTYDGDQWVHVEAVVYGDSLLMHIVEGDTVLIYEHPKIDDVYISKGNSLDWNSAEVTDYQDFINRKNELLKGGYIALQAESHPIDFKNLKLLNLEGCMDPQAKNYKAYYIKNKQDACRY